MVTRLTIEDLHCSSIDNIHGSSQRFCFRSFASRVVTLSPRVLRTTRRHGVYCQISELSLFCWSTCFEGIISPPVLQPASSQLRRCHCFGLDVSVAKLLSRGRMRLIILPALDKICSSPSATTHRIHILVFKPSQFLVLLLDVLLLWCSGAVAAASVETVRSYLLVSVRSACLTTITLAHFGLS